MIDMHLQCRASRMSNSGNSGCAGFQHYLQVTDFTERVCLGTDCILFWAILLGPSSQHIVISTAVVIIAVILLHILQVSSGAVVVNQIISLCTEWAAVPAHSLPWLVLMTYVSVQITIFVVHSSESAAVLHSFIPRRQLVRVECAFICL